MRHGLQVDDEEQDREQDQENTGNVDGQVEERQGGQQAGDDADDTRKDESGVGYPEADTDDGQQEEEVDEVGVGDRLQQLIEAAQVIPFDPGTGGLQRIAMTALVDLATVEVLKQGVEITSLEVDHPELDRVVGGSVDALPDGLLRPVRVAMVQRRQRPDIRGRIVFDLLHLDIRRRRGAARTGAGTGSRVGAAETDRMRRADVGSRRHRGDIGSLRDVQAGRRGASPGGRDEDHDRERRAEDLLDDVPHRGVEPARGVHLDDQGIRLVGDGFVDGLGDVVVGDGVDDPVEGGDQDVGPGSSSVEDGHKSGQHDDCEKEPGGPLHDLIIAPVRGPVVRRMRTWPNALIHGPAAMRRRRSGRNSRATHACPTVRNASSLPNMAQNATKPTGS